MTPTTAVQSQRQRGEAAAVENVINRLTTQFPELSRDEIVAVVQGRHHAFDEATVREFVPVLVERSARDDLRGPTHRHRA
jgi:putative cell wall-binding protein